MNAKEKAFELFVKFSGLTPSEGANSYEDLRSNEANDNDAAIQCAIICVEEILKTDPCDGYMTDAEYVTDSRVEYWEEVKAELERLYQPNHISKRTN